MNYFLQYSGSPGSVTATLTTEDSTVGTTSGLADEKAARKWTKVEAKAHKDALAIEAATEHNTYVTLSGRQQFSL